MSEQVDGQEAKLRGELVRLSDKFWGQGWGYGTLEDRSLGRVKITGCLEGLRAGMFLSIVGRWKKTKWGDEVVVETAVEEVPDSTVGIRLWLEQRLPQIGPERARMMVDRFGRNLWRVIEYTPEKLLEIDGITPARLTQIVDAYTAYKAEIALYVPLFQIGMTRDEAKFVLENGFQTDEVLESPFRLYLDAPHKFSFTRTELLAGRIGSPKTQHHRMLACAVESVRDQADDGHTYIPEREALEMTHVRGIPWSAVAGVLEDAVAENYLIKSSEGYVLPELYRAENSVAESITRLMRAHVDSRPDAGAGAPHDDGREPLGGDWRPGMSPSGAEDPSVEWTGEGGGEDPGW